MRMVVLLFGVLLITACSTERSVVQEGRLQKRSHQHGWHLDLHHGSDDRVPRERASLPRIVPRGLKSLSTGDPERIAPLSASANVEGMNIAIPTGPENASRPGVTTMTRPEIQPRATDPQEEPENLMPRKKLNFLAIPALVFGLGAIALGFFTTNTLAVVVAIVVTIAISGISLARMRKREQGGKGFALAGLMIGVIAAIFTTIAIAAYGIE